MPPPSDLKWGRTGGGHEGNNGAAANPSSAASENHEDKRQNHAGSSKASGRSRFVTDLCVLQRIRKGVCKIPTLGLESCDCG